eukprot:gene18099-biopygen20418
MRVIPLLRLAYLAIAQEVLKCIGAGGVSCGAKRKSQKNQHAPRTPVATAGPGVRRGRYDPLSFPAHLEWRVGGAALSAGDHRCINCSRARPTHRWHTARVAFPPPGAASSSKILRHEVFALPGSEHFVRVRGGGGRGRGGISVLLWSATAFPPQRATGADAALMCCLSRSEVGWAAVMDKRGSSVRARFERSVSNGPGEKSGLAHTSGHAPAQTDARVAAPTHRSDPQLRVRTGWGSPDPGTPRTPNAPRAPHLPAGERSGEPMQNPHKDVRQNAIRPSPDPRADAAPMRRQPNRDTELRPDVGGDQTVCALPVRNQRGFPGELTTLDEVTCAPKPGKVVAHKRPQADRVGRGKDVWGTTVRRHQQQSW